MSRTNWLKLAKAVSVLTILLAFTLSLSPKASSWSTSVHHDQAGTIHTALRESPSIPPNVREKIDFDTIYMMSTAPDDWREATGIWETYQYNMAENAYYEFKHIRTAWETGDYDNAVARIGTVLHYVGDAMQMEHNENLRDYYWNNIPPIGSEAPIWSDEEYGHHVRQQVEAYTDSNVAWYPIKPENYGTRNGSTDDGSLAWFLDNYFYDPAIDSDSPSDDYGTVIGRHIRETSPYEVVDGTYEHDNRWFYWRDTRDANQAKMDADNAIRLVYNGVYRALRDAYISQGGTWDWPTKTKWLSSRPYGEGMDHIRWYHGITGRGSAQGYQAGMLELGTTNDKDSEAGGSRSLLSLAFLAVGVTGLITSFWLFQRSQRGHSSRL